MTNEQALVDQAAEIQAALSRFHGCETFYRYWTGRLIYTEGVKYLADTAHCYWLIDAIASHQPKCRKDMMLADFQVWYLLREGQKAVSWVSVEGDGAVLTCWRDTPSEDTPPPIQQSIEFTDFPLAQIKLYYSMGVLMLPSEY
ncbi:hypothetical protein AVDCRST_MAG81-2002 [uncultured Synechococcales cyanobacterium]|uniref:DUF6876 domain-containing protein n=1 Tax=uncultured Synechococcales cyanobacterium TaxID=1936017 RepID=A0A6J4VB34_9CYAN|nr:hypothetical protein AVDCRST_MAG81-2002 [uncultured Synechococcales cyanobacterium]